MTSYADHVLAASRYAAAALTIPTPLGQHATTVRALQDDLAVLLTEMTREITGLTVQAPIAVDVADVARHPVRTMLNRLHALPARAGWVDGAPGPSDRLAGRPDSPQHATDPVRAWQGVVVEMAQARHLLTRHADQLADTARWEALAEIAALAETLATTRTDLLAGIDLATTAVRRDRSHAAALAVEAREVAHQAGTPTHPVGTHWASPAPRSAVVTITGIQDLPAAATNLHRLLGDGSPSITDLLAVTTLLAQTTRATATALQAAARHTPHSEHLSATATSLHQRADALSRAVAAERADLAALGPGSRALLAQGREIGACALPRLADLTRHPARATGAVPALLAYAATVPGLTGALHAGVETAVRNRAVAIRDPAVNETHPWRPATIRDVRRLLANLTTATPEAPPAPAAKQRPAQVAATTGLAAALERRRDELRPTRPASAALTGRFAPVQRDGLRRAADWT